METNNKKNNIFSIIKNIFIVLILLQFVPSAIYNIKKAFTKYTQPKALVGQINISGVITDSTFYVKNIKKFLRDPEIKALFVKIECPGGTPGSSQAVYEELKKFKEEKPVVVLVENLCASGAYYIACAANQIISPASSLIGSIGVYMQVPNVKELLDKWNIKFKFIKTGKFKTVGNPLEDINSEEINYLQELSNENYNQFTKDVAVSRKLDIKNVNIWADGQVFLATKALKLNLIDQIGSFTDAENTIKKLANIETEIKFVQAQKKHGLLSLLTQDDDNDQDLSLSSKIATFLHEVYLNLVNKSNITI
ncbi:MAG: Signal peptide peptidase SppA, 36K type [candidate division TM6 bacterium GW2011_GWF2_28_16]|nr:MAG: Signal peptide peptidase SppA, 36K type [candidate division TM6 bacterium GW2011_GWF2_28_16]